MYREDTERLIIVVVMLALFVGSFFAIVTSCQSVQEQIAECAESECPAPMTPAYTHNQCVCIVRPTP